MKDIVQDVLGVIGTLLAAKAGIMYAVASLAGETELIAIAYVLGAVAALIIVFSLQRGEHDITTPL